METKRKNRPQLWIDFETGGVEPMVSSPLSCAMLAVKDGEIVGEWYEQIRQTPFEVTAEAMEINKLNLEDPGLNFKDFKKGYYEFINYHFYGGSDWGRTAVGFYPGKIKASRENMPLFCGHNTFFDRQVLQQCLGGTHFKSVYDGIYYHRIDTMILANTLQDIGMMPIGENLKLETICKLLELEPEPGEFHNALVDIKMTFKAYKKMKEIIKGGQHEYVKVQPRTDFFHTLQV